MRFSDGLKKNSDFSLVYQKGRSRADRLLVLYVRRNGGDTNRVGISVSKKVGNSVVRHRIKRRLREAYRLNEMRYTRGVDLVIIVRAPAKYATMRELERSLLHLSALWHLTSEP